MNNITSSQKELSPEQCGDLLSALKARFEQNMNRHQNFAWAKVQAKLLAHPEKLWSMGEMEPTGGEPDVVGFDKETGEYIFYDCAAESPQGRRSFCYDRAALESRKANQPKNSAVEMAAAMDIELLTEEQYRELQKLGGFDQKTSSWVQTPTEMRNLGGALFGDRRYGQFSSITTGRNLTTAREVSAARSEHKFGARENFTRRCANFLPGALISVFSKKTKVRWEPPLQI